MKTDELVWAFKPLAELNNQTGFVTCDPEVAKKLIDKGDVQNPQVGALHLHPIEGDAPGYDYETKVMKPKRRRKKVVEAESEEPTDEAE